MCFLSAAFCPYADRYEHRVPLALRRACATDLFLLFEHGGALLFDPQVGELVVLEQSAVRAHQSSMSSPFIHRAE